jgi:hypothetical protein
MANPSGGTKPTTDPVGNRGSAARAGALAGAVAKAASKAMKVSFLNIIGS